MDRGDFDDLPGLGRPIEDLGEQHDPDWWLKRLVEREQITGVLPPALALRREDAELDARLDRLSSEAAVRTALTEFNDAVRAARYQPLGGPPMITRERDIDAEVERWRARRPPPPRPTQDSAAAESTWWNRLVRRRGRRSPGV